MLQIGETIVSREILETHFACNLEKCKGMCCVHGESGAPLNDDEIAVLQKVYPKVKRYMSPKGVAAAERQGVFATDIDDEKVTPLVGDSEDCVFAFRENDVYYCAIEKAYINGDIEFRKPVSCHLYPIRITQYSAFDAVNYHQWDICQEALTHGKNTATPLCVFLKEPLVRKYGAEWYEELFQHMQV